MKLYGFHFSVQMHSWRMGKVASVGYSINNMHFSSFSFIKKNQEKKFIYKYKAKMKIVLFKLDQNSF